MHEPEQNLSKLSPPDNEPTEQSGEYDLEHKMFEESGPHHTKEDFAALDVANHQRSDTLVKEDVRALLGELGLDATTIEVQVLNGVVLLNGDLGEKSSEHILVNALEAIPGVNDIRLNT